MSKSTPAAPDYTGAANAQASASREITNTQNFANRPDINTPFGNQTWSTAATTDPATGQDVTKWTQNTALTPQAQQALDSQLALQSGRSGLGAGLINRVGSEIANPVDWGKFQQAGGVPDAGGIKTNLDFSGATKIDPSSKYYDQAGKAVYDQFSNRNEPIFQRNTAALETQLRNQGLNPGDEAYDRALADLRTSQNDARTNASLEATKAAGGEAARMFGMDAQGHQIQTGDTTAQAQFGNTATGQQFNQNLQASNLSTQQRQQQIAEEMQKRGFSLNEINALINGQQVGMPQMPTFNTANASQTPNLLGAAQAQGQYNIDSSNAQNAMFGDILGAGAKVGAAYFSDRRLKTSIVPIGKYRGHQIYTFNYLWGTPSVGVMADEVPTKFVKTHASGYAMVDYAALLGAP